MQIDGVAALVTGAASGLGYATCVALADKGANVTGIDLPGSVAKAQAIANVTFIAADVTSEVEVQEAVAHAASQGPLRLAVNCAGIAPAAKIVSRGEPHDLQLFQNTININLVGTFNVMRLVAAAMSQTTALQDGQRGAIINTASVAAYEGQIGQAAYAASKAGVVGLTITAARDLAGAGIRVNTIAPGILDTPMLASFDQHVRDALAATVTFPKRLGSPTEFAKLVLMLAEHDYLNGETVRMDGAIRLNAK